MKRETVGFPLVEVFHVRRAFIQLCRVRVIRDDLDLEPAMEFPQKLRLIAKMRENTGIDIHILHDGVS